MRDARYDRQLILNGWGSEAQQKLAQSRMLTVGAGGLGCPVLQYLGAAGAGLIGIVDGDLVSETDLNRQIFYTPDDIGQNKALMAKAWMERFNPSIQVQAYPFRLHTRNTLDTLQEYDIILDCTDNFGTRYMLDDACRLTGKPLVCGSVSRFEGQVAVFNVHGSPGYRAWFPYPPHPSSILSCDEAGVLGAVAGITGTLQAMEAIKMATGIGELLTGKILTYQPLYNRFYEVSIPDKLQPNPGPKDLNAFVNWPYPDGCGQGS